MVTHENLADGDALSETLLCPQYSAVMSGSVRASHTRSGELAT
jgi:hypothetical protein